MPPVHPRRLEEIRSLVEDSISSVRAILKANRGRITSLPPQSRRALEYMESIDFEAIESIVLTHQAIGTKADVTLEPVNLYLYDNLLKTVEVC